MKSKTSEIKRIKKESQTWTKEKWEDYLSSLEVERTESLIDPFKLEEFKEEDSLFHFEKDEGDHLEDVVSLKRALKSLTFKQKSVIQMVFYEGLTEREISKKLNISSSAVNKRKRKAIQSLRRNLTPMGVSASPIVRGKFSMSDQDQLYLFEEIRKKNTHAKPLKVKKTAS